MNLYEMAYLLADVDNWLDGGIGGTDYRYQPMAQDWARISKVAEETGEAISAYIGVTGQNPRKGVTHSMDDVLSELADTAMTAILAIQHFTKDTDLTVTILTDKVTALHHRAELAQESLEDRTRRELAEAADTVQPREDGLQRIRERTRGHDG